MTLAILVNLLEKQRERETQWRKPCGWRGPSIVLSKTSGECSRCHFYTVALQEWLGSLLLEWWREEPVAPAAGCVPRNSSSRHSPGLWPLSFAPSLQECCVLPGTAWQGGRSAPGLPSTGSPVLEGCLPKLLHATAWLAVLVLLLGRNCPDWSRFAMVGCHRTQSGSPESLSVTDSARGHHSVWKGGAPVRSGS